MLPGEKGFCLLHNSTGVLCVWAKDLKQQHILSWQSLFDHFVMTTFAIWFRNKVLYKKDLKWQEINKTWEVLLLERWMASKLITNTLMSASFSSRKQFRQIST